MDAELFEDHLEVAPNGAVAEVHRPADLGGRMSLRYKKSATLTLRADV